MGHLPVVKLLLERPGVNINAKDSQGYTPLFWALLRGKRAVVNFLIGQPGIDLDSRSHAIPPNGQIPLSLAAQQDYKKLVQAFLSQNWVNPDSRSKNIRTPLSYAAEEGFEEVVELLLKQADVDSDSRSKAGRTPLSYAAETGREAVVKLLLNRAGINPDSRSSSGRTPLSYAAQHNYVQIVRLLLDRGANPNSIMTMGRFRGFTPLLFATGYSYEDTMKALLAHPRINPCYMASIEDFYGAHRDFTLWALAAREDVNGVLEVLKPWYQRNDVAEQPQRWDSSWGFKSTDFTWWYDGNEWYTSGDTREDM